MAYGLIVPGVPEVRQVRVYPPRVHPLTCPPVHAATPTVHADAVEEALPPWKGRPRTPVLGLRLIRLVLGLPYS